MSRASWSLTIRASSDPIFTFVTDGIESALAKAQAVAGEKRIGLMGANIDQQFLAAGLVDEIRIHVVNVLLGGGRRLFDQLPQRVELKQTGLSETDGVTHLEYRVVQEQGWKWLPTFRGVQGHGRAPAGAALDLELASDGDRAFPHSSNPAALMVCGVKHPASVVLDLNHQRRPCFVCGHRYFLGRSVAKDIGERFLDDPVDRQFGLRRALGQLWLDLALYLKRRVPLCQIEQ